jgi:hypothetical protein
MQDWATKVEKPGCPAQCGIFFGEFVCKMLNLSEFAA